MKRLLIATSNRLGPPPRAKLGYTARPPAWMSAGDRLRDIYERAADLMKRGTLVWGHFIQANSGLFQPSGDDAPGTILYATDLRADVAPEQLAKAAQLCFRLKDSHPVDDDAARVARCLTNEYGRHDRVPLPLSRTDGVPMTMAIAMVHRTHLPTGYLSTMLVPLLAHEDIDGVILLPCEHWADDLKRGWIDLGAEP